MKTTTVVFKGKSIEIELTDSQIAKIRKEGSDYTDIKTFQDASAKGDFSTPSLTHWVGKRIDESDVEFTRHDKSKDLVPGLIDKLKKARLTISRMKLSMLVHPDCQKGSEFDDRTSYAQQIEQEITELINKSL